MGYVLRVVCTPFPGDAQYRTEYPSGRWRGFFYRTPGASVAVASRWDPAGKGDSLFISRTRSPADMGNATPRSVVIAKDLRGRAHRECTHRHRWVSGARAGWERASVIGPMTSCASVVCSVVRGGRSSACGPAGRRTGWISRRAIGWFHVRNARRTVTYDIPRARRKETL